MCLLEEAKIDLNAKNQDGDTGLHLACNSGFVGETVQLLVRDPRCNPLEKNSSGDTVLHAACRRGRGEADVHVGHILFQPLVVHVFLLFCTLYTTNV